MYFRFGSAIVLVVLISLAGIAIEKRSLELRRDVSRQQYQLDILRDTQARLRLRTQELGAPTRLLESIDRGQLTVEPPEGPMVELEPAAPLLRWQRAGRDPR